MYTCINQYVQYITYMYTCLLPPLTRASTGLGRHHPQVPQDAREEEEQQELELGLYVVQGLYGEQPPDAHAGEEDGDHLVHDEGRHLRVEGRGEGRGEERRGRTVINKQINK